MRRRGKHGNKREERGKLETGEEEREGREARHTNKSEEKERVREEGKSKGGREG